jgi:hypothetical protein
LFTAFGNNTEVEQFNKMTLELTNPNDNPDNLTLVNPEKALIDSQYLEEHPDDTVRKVRLAVQVREAGVLYEDDVDLDSMKVRLGVN